MPEEPMGNNNNSAPRPNYALPISIVIAALIIGGSIVYLVGHGSTGSGTPAKAVDPLTAAYTGPTTNFSKCLDAKTYVALVQSENADGATAGVNSTPTTFVDGVKVTDSSGNSVGADATTIFAAIDAAVKAPKPEPTTGPLALTAHDVPMGNANAPVTVIEYGDYQCPFCALFFSQVEPTLVQNYVNTGKVKFVFRDFPFLGQESYDAGAAAECAQAQGKFWQYHDALYTAKIGDTSQYGGGEDDGFFNRNTFLNLAQQAGLN